MRKNILFFCFIVLFFPAIGSATLQKIVDLKKDGQFLAVDEKETPSETDYVLGEDGSTGEKIRIPISGISTATADIAASIHASTEKTTLVDADEVGLWDSVSSNLRKITWANIKSTLKIYFDTLYAPKHTYYVDASESDQGATAVLGSDTVYDIIDTVGSNPATIIFSHSDMDDQTTYTFDTDETIPANIHIIIERGAVLVGNTGDETLTISSTFGNNGKFKKFDPATITVAGLSYVQPEWWGAVGDNSTDCTAAFQAANACGESAGYYHFDMAPGQFVLSDQITLSNTAERLFTGAGDRVTQLNPTSWSPVEAVFYLDDSSDALANQGTFKDFEIYGNNNNRNDPIGFNFIHAKSVNLYRITITELGNTAILFTATNNCRLDAVRVMSCGRNVTQNTVSSSARVSITASSTTLTCDTSVFESDDATENRRILIDGAGENGEPLITYVSAYTSATQVTIAHSAVTTVSDETFSFGPPTGDITSADATLSVRSADTIFTNDDIGRYVYVAGAGANGDFLISKISSVTDGQTVELSENASTTVSNTWVYLTPSITSINPEDDRSGATRQTNDFWLVDTQVEVYRGCGYLFSYGTNVFGYGVKSHGIANYANNCGYSGHNYVVDNLRWASITGELDYGYVYDSGHLLITGNQTNVYWHDFQIYDTLPDNMYLVDMQCDNASQVAIGPGLVNTRREDFLCARLSGGATNSNVVSSGVLMQSNINDINQTPPSVLASATSSDEITLSDDNATSVNIPTIVTKGSILVWSANTGVSALSLFRTSNDGSGVLMEQIGTSLGSNTEITTGNLSGTTGTDAKFTISPGSDGKIYFENRRGVSVVFSYIIFGI